MITSGRKSFDHLIFCNMAWLYAARSSSYSTRCKSVNDIKGESSLTREDVGKTWRGTSFLTYSAPLPKTKAIQVLRCLLTTLDRISHLIRKKKKKQNKQMNVKRNTNMRTHNKQPKTNEERKRTEPYQSKLWGPKDIEYHMQQSRFGVFLKSQKNYNRTFLSPKWSSTCHLCWPQFMKDINSLILGRNYSWKRVEGQNYILSISNKERSAPSRTKNFLREDEQNKNKKNHNEL